MLMYYDLGSVASYLLLSFALFYSFCLSPTRYSSNVFVMSEQEDYRASSPTEYVYDDNDNDEEVEEVGGDVRIYSHQLLPPVRTQFPECFKQVSLHMSLFGHFHP